MFVPQSTFIFIIFLRKSEREEKTKILKTAFLQKSCRTPKLDKIKERNTFAAYIDYSTIFNHHISLSNQEYN